LQLSVGWPPKAWHRSRVTPVYSFRRFSFAAGEFRPVLRGAGLPTGGLPFALKGLATRQVWRSQRLLDGRRFRSEQSLVATGHSLLLDLGGNRSARDGSVIRFNGSVRLLQSRTVARTLSLTHNVNPCWALHNPGRALSALRVHAQTWRGTVRYYSADSTTKSSDLPNAPAAMPGLLYLRNMWRSYEW
jgi:hypothetical protein